MRNMKAVNELITYYYQLYFRQTVPWWLWRLYDKPHSEHQLLCIILHEEERTILT